MNNSVDVTAYLQGVDAAARPGLDRLRQTVLAACAGLTEEIKWNAPSYSHQGEDRVTLGLEKKGGYRVVLHRGAKPKALDAFAFTDDSGLGRWPAADRGVVLIRDELDLQTKSEALKQLIARWIAANTTA